MLIMLLCVHIFVVTVGLANSSPYDIHNILNMSVRYNCGGLRSVCVTCLGCGIAGWLDGRRRFHAKSFKLRETRHCFNPALMCSSVVDLFWLQSQSRANSREDV